LTRKLGDDVSAEMNWDPKSHPKLDFNEDYYTLLEVDPDIDSKMLKKAYYKMVFKYHPDNKETKEEKSLANKQMMVINGAYSVLKDAELRKIYDSKRKNGIFGASAVRAKAKYKYQSPTSSSNYSSVSDSSRQSRVDTNIPFEESRQRYQKTSETKCQTTESFSKQNEKFYNENEISGESIGDLLSDLWEDLSSRGGKRLLEDFKEILLEQV
jgi:DnaJ-class molecular chaperone